MIKTNEVKFYIQLVQKQIKELEQKLEVAETAHDKLENMFSINNRITELEELKETELKFKEAEKEGIKVKKLMRIPFDLYVLKSDEEKMYEGNAVHGHIKVNDVSNYNLIENCFLQDINLDEDVVNENTFSIVM